MRVLSSVGDLSDVSRCAGKLGARFGVQMKLILRDGSR